MDVLKTDLRISNPSYFAKGDKDYTVKLRSLNRSERERIFEYFGNTMGTLTTIFPDIEKISEFEKCFNYFCVLFKKIKYFDETTDLDKL